MEDQLRAGRRSQLSDLLETLGELLTPIDLGLLQGWPTDRPNPLITEAVMWDPLDPIPPATGEILLLISSSSDPVVLATNLREAARQGYAAVVIKPRNRDLIILRELAASIDTYLLTTPDNAPWTALTNLINEVTANPQRFGAGRLSDVAVGDLFALADAIAAAAGGAITIENIHREVLAYSNIPGQDIDSSRQNTILGRHVPGLPEYLGEYRTLAASKGPVHFPEYDDLVDRLAMPIRVGGRMLGSVWVLDAGARRLDAIAAVLVQVAPVVALHLVRAEDRYDMRRQQREQLLASILGLPGEMGVARATSIRELFPVVLMGFRANRLSREPLDERRIIDILSINADMIRSNSLCAQIDGVLFVLLPDATGLSSGRIFQLASSSIRAVKLAVGVDLLCAHSDLVLTMQRLPESRSDIETALRSLADLRSPSATCDVVEERQRVLLQELIESGVAAGSRLLRPLQRIMAHDDENGTFYAQTLLAHLDSFGDVRKAAKWNSVHENSQRYRMRRIVSEFELDLDDPTFRLLLWLQLRCNHSASP